MTEPTIYNLKCHLININDTKNLDELNKIMFIHNLSSNDKLSSIRILVTHSVGKKDLAYRIIHYEAERLF